MYFYPVYFFDELLEILHHCLYIHFIYISNCKIYNLCFLCREEENIKIITEQVSHHPPVSAFHVDSPYFTFSGAIHPKLKLWARSVEIKPEGTVVLKLTK